MPAYAPDTTVAFRDFDLGRKERPRFLELADGIVASVSYPSRRYVLQSGDGVRLVIEPKGINQLWCKPYRHSDADGVTVSIEQLIARVRKDAVPELPPVRIQNEPRLPALELPPPTVTLEHLEGIKEEIVCGSTALRDQVLAQLKLAQERRCPMAIGKAIALLSSDFTPGPVQRILPQHMPVIAQLREIRRSLFTPGAEHRFPSGSPLHSTLARMAQEGCWPSNELGQAYGDEMCLFAVLWANADSVAGLTDKGVHWVEAAGQLNMTCGRFGQQLFRMRKRGWVLPPSGDGTVRMPPGLVQHFLSHGMPAPGK